MNFLHQVHRVTSPSLSTTDGDDQLVVAESSNPNIVALLSSLTNISGGTSEVVVVDEQI